VTLRVGDVRDAYTGAAGAWAAGPASLYEQLAEPLVTHCPARIDGARVLDFGAGTGATTRVVTAAGGAVTAVDLALDMLRSAQRERPPAVNGDAALLPFAPGVFDVAVGAFVVSHIPDPTAALREVSRTVRADGAVMTVGFDGRWDHPAKKVVESVAMRFGFEPPPWYGALKQEVEPLTAFPERLATVAHAAGLVGVEVFEDTVDVGVTTADGIIAWRLGNAIYAPFVASLRDARRAELVAALRDAIGPDPEPVVPGLLVLSARARGRT
jgi:trans-aconitate methyltransferase